MPITPSLRHCSNKYKLAREGEKDKEKDEDFFLLLFFFLWWSHNRSLLIEISKATCFQNQLCVCVCMFLMHTLAYHWSITGVIPRNGHGCTFFTPFKCSRCGPASNRPSICSPDKYNRIYHYDLALNPTADRDGQMCSVYSDLIKITEGQARCDGSETTAMWSNSANQTAALSKSLSAAPRSPVNVLRFQWGHIAQLWHMKKNVHVLWCLIPQ